MSDRSLNNIMDFDHVVKVLSDGSVIDKPRSESIYAPTMEEGALETPETFWQLMTGYTGQHGYNGPTMHASESISGGLERDILATPGYYVAIVDRYIGCYLDETLDADEIVCDVETGCECGDRGWAVAYHHLEDVA